MKLALVPEFPPTLGKAMSEEQLCLGMNEKLRSGGMKAEALLDAMEADGILESFEHEGTTYWRITEAWSDLEVLGEVL